MIPFFIPRIDDKIINEVVKTLQSKWITTGHKTKLFEKKITEYTGCKTTVAVNSWTNGVQVLLNYWGIKEGDEIILPAYTYCATANVIIHSGAKPIMVDINQEDFNISIDEIRKAITPRTKAIILVDIAGFPCDYIAVNKLVKEKSIKQKFNPSSSLQKQLGRILIISDAAHSFGALFNNKRAGSLTDITSFSFHAVKNLTTAEGGALCFDLPKKFDHDKIYKEFCEMILHGQNKDALSKSQKGNWRYDVIHPGFKCNMTDLQASIGLVELERYEENLTRRKEIFELYDKAFSKYDWAMLPLHTTQDKISSFHLYQLRIKDIDESMRDKIIDEIFNQNVSVNVHFLPLPILTAYKKLGYKIKNYPETWNKYQNEISLPVYFDLTDEQIQTIIQVIIFSIKKQTT